ncbi:MAG: hypothetical protein AAF570_22075, partial [Bacteroidota bacterium]
MNIRWIISVLALGAVIGVIWMLFTLFSNNLREELQEERYAEARLWLQQICQLEKQYHDSTGVYTKDLTKVG